MPHPIIKVRKVLLGLSSGGFNPPPPSGSSIRITQTTSAVRTTESGTVRITE